MSEWLRTDTFRDTLMSVAILLVAAIVAAFLRLILVPVVRRLTTRTETRLDDIIVLSLRRPLALGVMLLGLYLALVQLNIWTPKQLSFINEAVAVAAIILLVYALLRVFNTATAYLTEVAAEKSGRPREVMAQSLVGRKVVNIVVLLVGILMILSELDIEIGPILAGLGLGGLAVALALQDTLANLFAGIYMMVDRPVAVGDFIKLESGEEGFVEEIGWRNTKVRMWANNIVIIPNSKLSQSVLTNYYLPQQEMSVYIRCGVAYDSDLEHVERVCIDVGKDVMARIPGSATEWEPVVRYKEFADFSINFLVVLRVNDFAAQYVLAHEYIKALHRRFDEEGIEIPFPIRTVIMRQPRAATEPVSFEGRTATASGHEVGEGEGPGGPGE